MAAHMDNRSLAVSAKLAISYMIVSSAVADTPSLLLGDCHIASQHATAPVYLESMLTSCTCRWGHRDAALRSDRSQAELAAKRNVTLVCDMTESRQKIKYSYSVTVTQRRSMSLGL